MKYFKDRWCEKCGEIGAKSEYHRIFIIDHREEYIKRTCSNCGNNWYEDPLDAKENATEA